MKFLLSRMKDGSQPYDNEWKKIEKEAPANLSTQYEKPPEKDLLSYRRSRFKNVQ